VLRPFDHDHRVADTVAIVSIVSTSTVALGVPFIAARLERRRIAWQDERRRADDLAGFLDSAFIAAGEAWRVRNELAAEFNADRSSSRLPNLKAQFHEASKTVVMNGLRMKLRVGRGSTLDEAHEKVAYYFDIYRRWFDDAMEHDGRATGHWKPKLEYLNDSMTVLEREIARFAGAQPTIEGAVPVGDPHEIRDPDQETA